MRTPEQLKGKVRNFAAEHKLMPQEVLQMYLLERVLERLSVSRFADCFILKGGMLISSMIGINERTTMDMDTTVTGITMDETTIDMVIREILDVDVNDGITFKFGKIVPIREVDDYNNFRAFFRAEFGKINNPMVMDITTGDMITPAAIDYSYRTLWDDKEIFVKAYNPETIIAEKFETIIRRNIGTTRARDFYDVYCFAELYGERIDPEILKYAIMQTTKKRGSINVMKESIEICLEMKSDAGLRKLWSNYLRNNSYVGMISFEQVMEIVEQIAKLISQ